MARFSDDSLRKLKDETDIIALIESYGTKLKQRGSSDEFIGLCPIHEDHEPSLCVNRHKKEWNCLGACQCGGDVFKWVMHAHKVGFRHAVNLMLGGETGSDGQTKYTTQRRLECPLDSSLSDGQFLQQVSAYYQSCLPLNVDAAEYLSKRGIGSAEAIQTFGIGFCDRSLGLRIPHSRVKAGSELRNKLTELGVLRASGHEHLRGCVTFPVTDASGVTQIYGRRIQKAEVRQDGKRAISQEAAKLWLSRPIDGLWNEAALQACDEIIVCESIIDALTFWCAGYRNVTTTFSSSFFPEQLKQAVLRYNVKRILLAYDNDEAGRKATERDDIMLYNLGLEVFQIRFPAGMDVNDYARERENEPGWAQAALGVAIRNADWLGKGSVQPAITTPTPNHSENARQQIAEELSRTAQAAGYAVQSAQQMQAAKEEASTTSTIEVTASPAPAAPIESEFTITDKEISFTFGNRSYRVRGFFEKANGAESLKINLLVRRDELFHVDTFDLYAARARTAYIKEAASELHFDEQVIKRDLGKVLLKLEQLQDQEQSSLQESNSKQPAMSEAEQQAALELLQSADLIQRILHDFDACGVVGEETNKLVGYLAVTSRKLSQPLAVLIQSSSAAGKSSLMEAVLSFMPAEDTIKYSAMTGQSLFYMGGVDLKHRILAIAEEEGVEQAAYALKLLQSEGHLTIASTGKDPNTGRMETQEYHVEGPVMIFLTTTSDETDPELKNRCITLGVCEHTCHTEAIHKQQRNKRTLEGRQLQQDRGVIRNLHQNAQRLLRPLEVVNNYAEQLTFRSDKTKSRRAHEHYLTLIEAVTLLHQYQRSGGSIVRSDGQIIQYIETTLEDIEVANRLADRFLERSFAELPERTQVLLEQIIGGVQNLAEFQQVELSEIDFTRKDVRRWSTFGDTQLKQHLARLVDYEYLQVTASQHRGRTLVYTLVYDPAANPTMKSQSGLVDVNRLRLATNNPEAEAKDGLSAGQKTSKVGPWTDKVGPENIDSTNENIDEPPNGDTNDENDQKGAA